MKKDKIRLWNYLLDTIESQKEEINRLLQLSITSQAEIKKLKEELETTKKSLEYYKLERQQLEKDILIKDYVPKITPNPIGDHIPNPYPITSGSSGHITTEQNSKVPYSLSYGCADCEKRKEEINRLKNSLNDIVIATKNSINQYGITDIKY